MREASWWIEYLNDSIRLNDNTPVEIVSIMEDWYEGRKSAMRRFVDGEPVKAKRLVAEVEQAVAANNCGKVNVAEAKRLTRLQAWVIREHAVAKAASALRKSATKFHQVLREAEFDIYYRARLFEAATKHLQE